MNRIILALYSIAAVVVALYPVIAEGRIDEAESVYQRARAILLAARGEESPEVATLYHNLGGLEHARGRYSRGEPFARHGLEIRERVLGPGHPNVAADAAALAAILDG